MSGVQARTRDAGRGTRDVVCEADDGLDEGLWLFEIRIVARGGNEPELGAWNGLRIDPTVVGRHDAIVLTPDDQGRYVDPRQSPTQLRVVHEGLPGEQGSRLAVTQQGDQLLLGRTTQPGQLHLLTAGVGIVPG